MQKTKMITDVKAMRGVKKCGWEYIICDRNGRMDTKHRDLKGAYTQMTWMNSKCPQHNHQIHKLDDLINPSIANDNEATVDTFEAIFGNH